MQRADQCRWSTETAGETRHEALRRDNERLQSRTTDLVTAFRSLDTLPDSLVVDLLRLAACAPDPLQAFVNARRSLAVTARPAPYQAAQLSLLASPSTLSAVASSPLERELNACHPLPYPVAPRARHILSELPPSRQLLSASHTDTSEPDLSVMDLCGFPMPPCL